MAAGLCDTVGLGGSGYSVTGLSLVSPTLLAINYYDDYSFLDTSLFSAHKVFLLGALVFQGFHLFPPVFPMVCPQERCICVCMGIVLCLLIVL